MQQTLKANKLAERALSGFEVAQKHLERSCELHAEAKAEHRAAEASAKRLAAVHAQGIADSDAQIDRLQRVRARLQELVA